MNRRGFFSVVGGGVIGAVLVKAGFRKKKEPESEVYCEISGLGKAYAGDRLQISVFMGSGASYTWSVMLDEPGKFGLFMGPRLGTDDKVVHIYAFADSGRLSPEVNLYALRKMDAPNRKEQRHIARIYHMDPKADFWPIGVPVWAGETLCVTVG